MNIPQDLKYTKEHEWISINGNIGTVGITDYAQGELGDVVFVDIDPKLQEVIRNANFGTIEAVKTVSELYAPISGKIIEINKKLIDSPESVNSDPYGEGWMIKIVIADKNELNDLLDEAAYSQLIGE
ncbi:MAG: glycine cleavage system protein GcvH [Ignavibacteriaceae bacterium]|nr:glycine cleavage system protein GcvH [Ignavibacteriaceae bacterium]